MSAAVVRSVLRYSAAPKASAARLRRARCYTPSPFRIPNQNILCHRIFRSPVEMSCCVETMLPYHTATASALLNTMLSVSRRSYGWTPEDCTDDV